MKLEVEVLNGLCYCRFRREAIGGCGVEWRTAGLRRGRAKRLRIRIGEMMDMRVGSYFCFLFRDARLQCVRAYWDEIFTRRKLSIPIRGSGDDHVRRFFFASFSPFISHVCKSNIFLLKNELFISKISSQLLRSRPGAATVQKEKAPNFS
jgi:hypothetical protein